MLTISDKEWVKDMVKDVVHEKIAELIVDHIQPTLATKDDLKRFATKDDLKRFATKDDLRGFVTKDEFHEFRTEIRESLNEIKNTLDHFLGEIKDSRQEHDVVSHRVYRDHAPKIEDHEKRITKLESRTSAHIPAV